MNFYLFTKFPFEKHPKAHGPLGHSPLRHWPLGHGSFADWPLGGNGGAAYFGTDRQRGLIIYS